MTIEFSDHFWGPKNNGFDVLYHNMKYGLTSSRELSEFFRERSVLEENHSKALAKLSRVASNGTPNGTFGPVWQILRVSTEKLSNINLQMVQTIQDIVKDLTKYGDELQKKYKVVKEEEAGTLEIVQLIQSSLSTVQKAKEIYFQRATEVEKLQKDNASQKDIEKAEVKARKSYEEYKQLTEKYSITREDFERKMLLACKHFQDVEIQLLTQLKGFIDNYANVLDKNHELIGQVHTDFRQSCSELTVENLLEQFVDSKGTGIEKPGLVELEEYGVVIDKTSNGSGVSEDKSCNGDKSVSEKKREGSKGNSSTKGLDSPLNLSADAGQAGNKPTLTRNSNRGSKWDSPTRSPYSGISMWTAGFLRSRRDKKKEKKLKKKDGASLSSKDDKSDVDDKDESHKSADTPSAEIDDEGFTVRPKTTLENDKSSFYSSSDSDSDDEVEKRLRIEIKPLSNGTAPLSASVDELRNTVESMTLSPIGLSSRKLLQDAEGAMKRSQSVSQQIGSSSPPSRHPYTPLSPPIPPPNPRSSPKTLNSTDSTSRYADLGDLFREVGEIQPALPSKTKAHRESPIPNLVAIPRPPSRPKQEVLQRTTSSSSPAMSRTESIGSLDTRSVGSVMTGSRGPSPLTLGMSDTIPLAVAFHEIVHACFKGNDEKLCQVKMTGDMMLSFPAGIIQVFANNPIPNQLSFQVRTVQELDNLVSNQDLVSVTKKNGFELLFDFNMSALVTLLKKHAEENANASYFNVNILKYQIIPKPKADSCPLHLVAFWKCEMTTTDLRIDYKYNSHAMSPVQSPGPSMTLTSKRELPPLVQVCVAAPVDGGVKSMHSKPSGQWFPNTNRACWKLPLVSATTENKGVGSLRARFEIGSGPSSIGTIAAQFSCENSTLSGCDFQVVGSGYRVSLIKKRFVSGKYTCDADSSYRYAVPPCDNASHI